MSKEILLYTDLDDQYENYVDVFENCEVKVRPYQLTWKDKLGFVAAFFILITIGVGIMIEEPPEETKEYALFGILCLMFIGIFGGLAWHVFFKPQADYYMNDQGFKAGLKSNLVPWQKVKDVAIDFLGMKIYEKNGKKHRIYIHNADDQYRFNIFLSNLVWVHNKYSITSQSLVQSLLSHIEKGMEFGKEQARLVRDREIKYYLGILGLTVFGALVAAAFIWVFDYSETREFGYSSKKAIIIFGFAILVDLFLLFRAFTNDVHKKAQNITANSNGLDIKYADGRQQNVTWGKMLELWEDPNYGQNGKFYFEIWHSTDGGMLLINLLPYAADYFTSNPAKEIN